MTENDIEQLTIELLENAGYQYLHGTSIAPDSDKPERQSFEDVLLIDRLRNAVSKINPSIPENVREDAIKKIQRLNSPELIANNESFHRMLTEGINVSLQKDGNERGDLVWLIDFKNPENNDYLVVNQFTIVEKNNNKRPDLIIFVNGLPLVVFELKNAEKEQATVESAYQQIQTYKAIIPSLFNYNSFCVISDGLDVRAGSISAEFTRFMTWKAPSDQPKESTPLNILIDELLNKKRLLDYIGGWKRFV
jgi:type I restriction enzyme R subunit